MQSLIRFWHWQRNEQPSPDLAGKMLEKNLSPLATLAVVEAQKLIAQVTLPRAEDWPALLPLLERLSLSICETYEACEKIRAERADACLGQW